MTKIFNFIAEARAVSQQSGRRMIEVLEENCGLPPDDFVRALGEEMHYAVRTMRELHALSPNFGLIAFADAMQRECIAFDGPDGGVSVVFSDPFNEGLEAWVQERVRGPVHWYLAHRSDVAAYLNKREESIRALEGMLPDGDQNVVQLTGEELSIVSISESSSPIIKLVYSTLYDALKLEASDIHLETNPNGLVIKYRVDGVLGQYGNINDATTAEQVISRIKVMSELDISEKRVPQDGRFRVQIRGRDIDFRVSIMPSIHGEDSVIRILDKKSLTDHLRGLRLDYLGFDERSMHQMRLTFSAPYGMVLVTGPTGSGKTTTLYAAISEINNGLDKIITIEDPVEYQLQGVLQIPVNEKKGLTFARGLRSILRHDPDKIMVGEIRDPETAQIAVQSALTGHLVFTTVHANNVFDVIGRFVNMEVDTHSFVSALNVVMAQRLIRLICPQCAEPTVPSDELIEESRIPVTELGKYEFKLGKGCGNCRGSGYRGRRAISEILTMTDEIRELIVARAPIRSIKDAARRGGTRYLRENALEMVRAGTTSLQEANRVTFAD